jgi:2-polyprenyl-6-methoxyphenol hydroxylase-like FAD-dependent oxidoreductase
VVASSVAIVGGGIGGYSLALSLHAAGFSDVDVFESMPTVRELGVGINILPHAARELTELGLADALDRVAVRTGRLIYCTARGQEIWSEPRGLAAGYRWPQWSIHRGLLLRVLHDAAVDRLGEERIHLGYAVASPGEFDASHDLIVGCDGVHSVIRRWLVRDEGPPLWNGVTMWRGAVEAPSFLGGRTMVMIGVTSRRVVVYPIADLGQGRQVLNWVAEVKTADARPMPRQEWDRHVDLAEPLAHFAAFRFAWLDVPALIGSTADALVYPMVDREPLLTWGTGRVTLLGDAAHPMYPIGANGASQAILDARVLARALAAAPTVEDAVAAYQFERLPATTAISEANRRAGPERCMDIVAERAPQGFDRISDIMTDEELLGMVETYRKLAGFDRETLNQRASHGV